MNERSKQEQRRDAERIRRALELERRAERKAVGSPKRGSCLIFVLFVIVLAAAALYVRANWDRFEHLFQRSTAPGTTTSPDGDF